MGQQEALTAWNHLVAEVNGRRVIGMKGVRALDDDENCDAFDPGDPGAGRCDTDGHYMCLECREMSLKESRRRREECETCGTRLVPVPGLPGMRTPEYCPECRE